MNKLESMRLSSKNTMIYLLCKLASRLGTCAEQWGLDVEDIVVSFDPVTFFFFLPRSRASKIILNTTTSSDYSPKM